MEPGRKRVLVLCTGNSCRSQMAEGWLRHDLGDAVEAYSAGTHPCFVHPDAIEVMREAGVDISAHRSKPVRELAGETFDLVITVCDSAAAECPSLPGASRVVHEAIDDPVGNPPRGADGLDDFRRARDEIRERVVGRARSELGLDGDTAGGTLARGGGRT